jgi:hypothetical protein
VSEIFGWINIKSVMFAFVDTASVYDVAPAAECQTHVGLFGETLVAPFAGEISVGAWGGVITVNE